MMPSLLKYFTIVGGVLVALLVLVNSILEPGGPGPTMVKAAQPKVAIKHDPRASLVERLRAEEAAQRSDAKVEAVATPVTVAEPAAPIAQPVTAAVTPPSEPAQVTASAALAPAPTEDEAARAVQLAQKKMKAEKARKQRLARERKALEQAASRQQDQFYYGYAPRPSYGPFGQAQSAPFGGWGQAQRW